MDDNEITAKKVDQTDSLAYLPGHAEILPDSRLKQPKNVVFGNGFNWVPLYCANCGADGGLVPEENMTFAFYLCNKCAETYGEIAGHYMVPDEVFWAAVKLEQIEKYGRELTAPEIMEILKDDHAALTKMVREYERVTAKNPGRG